MRGTTLAGRYTIQDELGAGGMAVVYLAHDLQHDRKVALKVLRSELAAVIGADRFLAEIRTTANLQHPHILALYDSGQVDGTVYYVMPYVDGESLRDRLDHEKQLPVEHALKIAREVAAALDYAHRQGVIHRDIKPENILLHDGQAIVADFGIAFAVTRVSDTRMTETGMSLGTPTYMSPEQTMGERTLDARTDVYALGCVLFEMLAGEPPFTGPTAQSIVAKVLTEEPRSLTTLRRSVPPNVDAVVRAALEKLPADRIGSAREFADALSAPGFRTRGLARTNARSRSVARHPLVLLLGSAVVLLATALSWQAVRQPPAAAPMVTRFVVELPLDLRLAMLSLSGPNVAISPDGRSIVFLAEGPDGVRRLYLRAIDEIDMREFPGTEGASQPSFSHDGRWIAYVVAGRLMRIAVVGGAPVPIIQTTEIIGHTWTPSGEIVVPDDALRVLATVPATGGVSKPITQLDSARGEALQISPLALHDGEHILYSSWGSGGAESARIGVTSLRTGRSTRLDLVGVTPLGMIDNHIVYATTNSEIHAAPVDLRAGRVTGEPIAVLSGVTVGGGGRAKAALSPTGTLVYLGGTRTSQMVLVGLDGGDEPVMPEWRAYGYPRYSPDGRSIAVTIASGSTSDVWIYDLASRTNTRLTSGGSNNERPEWTPDGERVLFRTDRPPISSIWWRSADHSDAEAPLVSDGTTPYFEAVLTPDGKAVVLQIDYTGADVVYRALAGDTTSIPIANSDARENAARISPDGRWVAFVTDASGSRQVVVQPLPGPGPRVQVSTGAGSEPVWSRDGRRLFYRGLRRFVAVDYEATNTFTVTARRELMDDTYQPGISPHANYDVAPDGTALLVLKGTDLQRLVVVQNWADEVRSRVARD